MGKYEDSFNKCFNQIQLYSGSRTDTNANMFQMDLNVSVFSTADADPTGQHDPFYTPATGNGDDDADNRRRLPSINEGKKSSMTWYTGLLILILCCALCIIVYKYI